MQRTDQIFLDRYAALYVLASSIPSDDRFGIRSWGERNRDSECGTTACLAGHAALHPHFVAQGFKRAGWDGGSSCQVDFDVTEEQRNSPEYQELRNLSRADWDPYVYGLAYFWGMGVDEVKVRHQRQIDDEGLEIMLHPFWPTSYIANGEGEDGERYLPNAAQAAAYVLEYMRYWWSRRSVDGAIVRNRHVKYDPDFVHFYTNWQPQGFTTVEMTDWKNAAKSGKTTLSAFDWLTARRKVAEYAKVNKISVAIAA